MARTPSNELPRLRRHKKTGQAVTTLTSPSGTRKDYYFGRYGSQESKQKYDTVIATWLGAGRQLPDPELKTAGDVPLTLEALGERFLAWAETYYRHQDGTPTGEAANLRRAMDLLNERHGRLHPADFTPNRLRELQEQLVTAGLTRGYINTTIRRVRQMFRWAEAREWVPAATFARLLTVANLKAGRCGAPEGKGLGPVPARAVLVTLRHLNRQVGGLVRFCLRTGARMGEAVQLATRYLDMTGPIWRFTPPIHKTGHKGKQRVIFIGHRAQKALRPFIRLERDRPWFRPCDAVEEHREKLRANRKTPLWPSHLQRQEAKRKPDPKKAPGERYTTGAVGQAIRKACERAGVEAWSCHQLRHLALSRIRVQHGIEAAAAVAGHSVLSVTEGYTSSTRERLAVEAVKRLG